MGIMGFAKHIVNMLPIRTQRILLLPYSKLVLREQRQNDKELSAKIEYKTSETEEFRKFKKLLTYAYNHVPYYKKAYDDAKTSPQDIKTVSDIKKLPLIDKRIVIDNIDMFLSDEAQKEKLEPHSTGGSSGIRLTLLYDQNVKNGRRLGVLRWMFAAGIKNTDKGVWVGRAPAKEINGQKNAIGFYNPVNDRLQLWINNMNESSLIKYVNYIKKFGPDYIQGYATGVATIAKYMLQNNLQINCKAVLTSSEKLSDENRKCIEQAFSCKVFDRYGLGEEVASAFECDAHDGYHIETDRCFVEVLGEEGIPVVEQEGEIVGTCLDNFAFPLIRYKTGDRAKLTYEKCKCGNTSPRLVSLIGRDSEYLLTKDNGKITNSTVSSTIVAPKGVLQYQIIQQEYDVFTVVAFVTDKDNFKQDELSSCIRDFAVKYLYIENPQINIEIKTESITEKNGKTKYLICNVNQGD